jgi:hypothetical protein
MNQRHATGKARNEGTYYKDGVERMNLSFTKDQLGELPAKEGERVPVYLLFGRERLLAGVRMTKNCPYAWICPDLYDERNKKHRITDLLCALGIENTDSVRLKREGDVFRLQRTS